MNIYIELDNIVPLRTILLELINGQRKGLGLSEVQKQDLTFSSSFSPRAYIIYDGIDGKTLRNNLMSFISKLERQLHDFKKKNKSGLEQLKNILHNKNVIWVTFLSQIEAHLVLDSLSLSEISNNFEKNLSDIQPSDILIYPKADRDSRNQPEIAPVFYDNQENFLLLLEKKIHGS